MAVLSRDELRALWVKPPKAAVSVYMPTHRASYEEDQIRLRNTLRGAEKQLSNMGLRVPESRQVVAQAEALLPERPFWQQLGEGLAIFVAPGVFKYYRLPYLVPELVTVAERFHLKPLLPAFSDDMLFYILALSQNKVRMFQCTRENCRLLTLDGVPGSLVEAVGVHGNEREVGVHTTARPAAGRSGAARPAAVFHSQGGSPEHAKEDILRFFQRINSGIHDLLREERSPLVIAGVDYLHPIYREANSYAHLLEKGIMENPDEVGEGALHKKAWGLIQPLFDRRLSEAKNYYEKMVTAGKTTGELERAVVAAQDGLIYQLFVARDRQQWGIFDVASRKVTLKDKPQPGDEDLLDFVTIHTLMKRGTVFTVKSEDVPGGSSVAAVLRLPLTAS